MPWLLDTPIAVGDLDPNGPYTHVNITNFDFDDDDKCVQVRWKYGTLDGNSKFVVGITPVGQNTHYTFIGQEYDNLIDHDVPDGITKTYISVKDGLYEALAVLGKIASGSLV